MSSATAAVLVAAAALVVSAVMQFFTIRTARRNTVSQLRADVTEARIADLADKLGDYMSISYLMDLEQKTEKGRNAEFSDDYYERARREDLLRTRILLQLDPEAGSDRALRDSLENLLRASRPFEETWIARRDALLAVAQASFAEQRRQATAQ
jgi:hypothetical protein